MAGVLYDAHFDDEHRILRKTLAITDSEVLEQHIARLSFQRVVELEELRCAASSTFRIFALFIATSFPWAGDFREVTTSRTNSFGFPPPQFLGSSLETVFNQLRSENYLKNHNADQFAIRAGYYLGEINAIHPFREGNGRTQREFIRRIAIAAGHRLVWRGLEPEENNSASRINYATGNSDALAAMIRKRMP